MTSPAPFNPPANPYGRTAKELLGLGNRYGGSGMAGTGVGVLPFNVLSGFGFQMVNMPAAATYWGWLTRPWYPAGWATHVRLVTDIGTAGFAGSRFVLQRCTDITDPDDDANWASVGISQECIVYIDQTGPRKGKWIKLSTLSRADNIFRVVSIGGDGIVTPEHGLVYAEFEFRREPLRERWYWRQAAPAEQPTWDNPTTFYVNTDLDDPADDVWVTPTPADVTANPGTLQINKNVAAIHADSSTSVDAHIDVSGVVKRFVGPPLRKQTIPAFSYKMGFAAQAPSGGAAGGYVRFHIGIYRPSDPSNPVVILEDTTGDLGTWFRFDTKQRVYIMEIEDEVDVEDGDRIFLDIIGTTEVGPGALTTTNGLGVNIHYDGAHEDFVDGVSLSGLTAASWVELPVLAYFDKDPT